MGTRRFIPYRRDLKGRSQVLRRDPTPAERKLWFEFLRDPPEKFTRQKPLGHYIADFYFNDGGEKYDARRTAALEAEGVRVLRVTNLEVSEEFEGVCQRIRDALTRVP
jgi:very-short-patch-repair endonuclease